MSFRLSAMRRAALSLVLAAPLWAQASYSISNSAFTCSSALSFASGSGLDAHCTGNFSITGGIWTSDTKIALSADGSLTLDGVSMMAPWVDLTSLTAVNVLGLFSSNGSVNIVAPAVTIGLNGSEQGRDRLAIGGTLALSNAAATITASSGTLALSGGSISVSDLSAPTPTPMLTLSAGVAQVPEPSSAALLVTGLLAGLVLARRKA